MDDIIAGLVKANQAAATAAVVSSLEQGWASTQKAVQSRELCGCDAVMSEWAALRRSVSNAGDNPEAVESAIAMFCTEVVLADVVAGGKAEEARLSDELTAERKQRQETQAELIAITERQQQGLAEARQARDAQAGDLQERLDAALAAQREESHVSALQKLQWEKDSMELKLKATYNEAEIARLHETVTRVEHERDALQKSLAAAREELSKANEARAELVGKLAAMQPTGGAPGASSMAAPPPHEAPAGVAQVGFQSPSRATNPDATSASSGDGADAASVQGPVMTAEMLKAGRAGDATAQCVIGYCYAAGQGVRQHWAEALKWYRAAAEQGHPNAQYNLGTCYAKGRGVRLGVDVQTWDECWEKAVYWFSLAAAQGDAAAQCNLATCYLKGQGVEQDRQEAIRWYEQAAQRGDEKARRHLEALLGR
jgi:TPR repeat protein